MDVSDLFNDATDSDLDVHLSADQTIHVHKLILRKDTKIFELLFKEKLSECAMPVSISLPEYSANVIYVMLSFVYKKQNTTMSLTAEEWIELINTAANINHTELIDYACEILPRNISPVAIVVIGVERNLDRVLSIGVDYVYWRIADGNEAAELAKNINELDWPTYLKLHRVWINSNRDRFLLLKMDCHYCNVNNGQNINKMINNLLIDFDYSMFTQQQIRDIKRLPIVKDSPLLLTLIEQISQLSHMRISGK